jgi:hypothetical protein
MIVTAAMEDPAVSVVAEEAFPLGALRDPLHGSEHGSDRSETAGAPSPRRFKPYPADPPSGVL